MGGTSIRPEAGMPFSPRKLLMVALLPLIAGCSGKPMDIDDLGDALSPQAQGQPATLTPAERDAQRVRKVRPGLEPLYANRTAAPPAMEPPPPMPVPPPAEAMPFPAGRLSPEQAEVLLAGDPMAQRFLAVKQLAGRGLVPLPEAAERKDTNLGALLPLTAPQPPAAGLERPLPPLADIVARFDGLYTGANRGTTATRAAERDFLLDALLPKAPASRQPYSPPDIASARKLQDRLGRLDDAGLITPDERARETAAIDQLIAGGTLPELLAPPKPPEPPKAKKKPRQGRGNRMPGGVSGRLEVVPSPPGVEPPPLSTKTKGPAGMHLLSMGSASHGDKAWDALQKENPELANLGHTVSRTDLGDLGVTYRLIAGPVDATQAASICGILKTRGQTCTPTPFPAAGDAAK
jgi:hypothetical protein